MNKERLISNLKCEYNTNTDKIKELTEQNELIKKNMSENRIITCFCLSSVVWTILVLLSPSIIKTGILSTTMLEPIYIGISSIIGLSIENYIHKKNKKELSMNYNNNSELKKVKIENDIELSKLVLNNNIIKNIINKLNNNEISKISASKIDNNIKNNIDNSINKFILKQEFWMVRYKHHIVTEIVLTITGAILFTLFYKMPSIMNSASTELISIIIPTILSSVGGLLYINKTHKEDKELFDSLNSDFLLEEYTTEEKDKLIDIELHNNIEELSKNKWNEESSRINPKEKQVTEEHDYYNFENNIDDQKNKPKQLVRVIRR